MYGASATAAGAAARAAAERMRKEEEEMTGYKTEDLEGWEFKIVRSMTGRFKDRQFLQQICQEEGKAGWEMLEKFDDTRVRFKRRVERREQDHYLTTDPYRINVGFNPQKLALVIVGIVVLVVGVGMMLTFVFSTPENGRTGLPFLMIGIILIITTMLIVLRLMSGRSRSPRGRG